MTRRRLDPFNVRLLVLTDQRIANVGQVTSLDYFDTATKEFHDEGLFSTKIFGQVGDVIRKRNFGYIDTRMTVFHPVIYRALMRLRGLNAEIMSGKKYAVWDDEKKDFVESNPIDGETGFSFFIRHWKNIEFIKTNSPERNDRIALIEKYKEVALTHRIPVMPAGLRDLEITADGRPSADEVNEIYRRLISISNTVPNNFSEDTGDLFDGTRWRLQTVLNDLYLYFEGMTRGKKKFMMGKFASRRIQNSTRNVISAYIPKNKRLGEEGSISIMDNIVGIYQGYVLIRPVTLFHVKRLFIDPAFTSPQAPARLIDKKTLQQVEVNLASKDYDDWMTNEGLNRQLGFFSATSVRHRPIEIDGHYLALIYKGEINGKKVHRIFHDIRDLPQNFKRKDVYPVTLAELIFLSIYKIFASYPSFNVRYPIDNAGSIQPNSLYLKSTVPAETRYELNSEWELTPESHRTIEFPVVGNDFHDTSTPHVFRLAAQGGDYDGDTNGTTALVSQNGRKEVRDFMKTKQALLGPDGEFKFSVSISPVELFLYNFTGDPVA